MRMFYGTDGSRTQASFQKRRGTGLPRRSAVSTTHLGPLQEAGVALRRELNALLSACQAEDAGTLERLALKVLRGEEAMQLCARLERTAWDVPLDAQQQHRHACRAYQDALNEVTLSRDDVYAKTALLLQGTRKLLSRLGEPRGRAAQVWAGK